MASVGWAGDPGSGWWLASAVPGTLEAAGGQRRPSRGPMEAAGGQLVSTMHIRVFSYILARRRWICCRLAVEARCGRRSRLLPASGPCDVFVFSVWLFRL